MSKIGRPTPEEKLKRGQAKRDAENAERELHQMPAWFRQQYMTDPVLCVRDACKSPYEGEGYGDGYCSHECQHRDLQDHIAGKIQLELPKGTVVVR